MEEKIDDELKIKKIPNGIVLDHLPRGKALDVAKILSIDRNFPGTVSVAMNVFSPSRGSKDIVKIEGRNLNTREIDKIAIIAPNATVNIIRDFKVIEKRNVQVPDVIDVIECPNATCITNMNEPLRPKLSVESKNPLKVRCQYCERVFEKSDLVGSL